MPSICHHSVVQLLMNFVKYISEWVLAAQHFPPLINMLLYAHVLYWLINVLVRTTYGAIGHEARGIPPMPSRSTHSGRSMAGRGGWCSRTRRPSYGQPKRARAGRGLGGPLLHDWGKYFKTLWVVIMIINWIALSTVLSWSDRNSAISTRSLRQIRAGSWPGESV